MSTEVENIAESEADEQSAGLLEQRSRQPSKQNRRRPRI